MPPQLQQGKQPNVIPPQLQQGIQPNVIPAQLQQGIQQYPVVYQEIPQQPVILQPYYQ